MTSWTTPATAGVRNGRSGAVGRRAAPGRWQRIWHGDWALWAAVLSLAGLGVVLIAAATKPLNPTHPFTLAKQQLLFLVVGAAFAVLASLVEYRTIRAAAPVLYVLALGGLVATFVVGVSVNGSRAWLRLPGGLSLEPSEFAKLALIVLAALVVNARVSGRSDIGDFDVVAILAFFAVPTGLVLLQRDLGTGLVILVILFGVLAVGGAPTRWLVGLTVLVALAAVVAVKFHLLHGYQEARLTAFLHPESGTQTYGYNAYQARIAIGSGGLHGTGLFHGSQINNGYVFAAHTDFIFATAGEELGFLGGGLIILLLTVILWRGLRIAAHAPDAFGRVTAAGVVCWFAFESFENIGMNLGIMPITGIPLQFVSYGGSSLFASMLAIGLLQNIAIQAKVVARIAPE
ncbi:cell cycle protein [Acidothermus cellulolyticus 11B]|uniref:peptidoglycan glycosyltransferase n=1 Tax=Acidothermus cellulolyticus (strain ATCC 43068 / DSM 8971 / 11B) TaxID=351607 RepID=A0LSW5_ACIC1|nr:FtsW/RodA/SpoVE family cell cycle protein [Acidothermus cellulolyticus]ABK52525.1 cell cycle protein [Acidothermus cellulolyticus 11B]